MRDVLYKTLFSSKGSSVAVQLGLWIAVVLILVVPQVAKAHEFNVIAGPPGPVTSLPPGGGVMSMDWEPIVACEEPIILVGGFDWGPLTVSQCTQDIARLTNLKNKLEATYSAGPSTPPSSESLSAFPRPDLTNPEASCVNGRQSRPIRVGEFSGTAQDNYSLTYSDSIQVMQTVSGLPDKSLGLRCSVYISNMSNILQYVDAFGTFVAQERTQIQPRTYEFTVAADCDASQRTILSSLRGDIQDIYRKLDQQFLNAYSKPKVSTTWTIKSMNLQTEGVGNFSRGPASGPTGWMAVQPGQTLVMTLQTPAVDIIGNYPGMRRIVSKMCSGWVRVCSNYSQSPPGTRPYIMASGNIESVVSSHSSQDKVGTLRSTAFSVNKGRGF